MVTVPVAIFVVVARQQACELDRLVAMATMRMPDVELVLESQRPVIVERRATRAGKPISDAARRNAQTPPHATARARPLPCTGRTS